MAPAGTLGAAGCHWPPATTNLPASLPSSSVTSRMSAATDAPSLSLFAGWKGAARGRVALGSPRSPPLPASS